MPRRKLFNCRKRRKINRKSIVKEALFQEKEIFEFNQYKQVVFWKIQMSLSIELST